MNYRTFGKLDWKPSALGFGCMRLPCRSGGNSGADVDEELAVRMIRLGIDRGVNIPFNFELYNAAVMYDDAETARFRYGRFMAEGERASACVACGACESKCPQKIHIGGWMPKAAALLGGS